MKKPWWCITISVLVSACLAGSVFAQVSVKEQSAVKKASQVTFKGKIVYSATMKRYVIRGRGEIYGIANQNSEALGQLAKGKQTVTVEGRNAGGDSLFIEKINGAPYQGENGPGLK